MIRGSCLCGQIKYQLDGGVELMNNCHCAMCRKAHGAAFGSFLHAASAGFRWTAGEDGGEVNIPAGTLDDDPGVRPIVNIFVGSRAPWFDIDDSLPRFDEFPPREFWEGVT